MARTAVKLELKPYQEKAVKFVLRNTHCALWLDMGLGKTAITLTAIKALVWSGEVERVLVIAPKRPIESTWPDEINKWSNFKGLHWGPIVGTPAQREALLEIDSPRPDITLISFDNLIWLVNHYKKKWPFGMVVIDEASRIKNPSAKRFRALKKIRNYTDRIVELTGTPAPNGLLDVWAPMYLLDEGQRLGRTMTQFKGRWFVPDGYMGYGSKPIDTAQIEIEAAVSDLTISMQAEDYLTLPDRVNNYIPVHLTQKELKQYRAIENDLFLQLEAGDIDPQSQAAATNKCLQFANGAVYLNAEEEGSWEEVHTAKLDALESVIEEAAGAPVLVAYWFKPDLERLMRRFPQGQTLIDEHAVDRWNMGEIPLLFIHPMSAGHGLNLQFGGNILVWFSMTWNLEAYQQTNARLHRQGQEKPVYIHHLLASDTLDEDVVERLEGKASVQDILMRRMNRG